MIVSALRSRTEIWPCLSGLPWPVECLDIIYLSDMSKTNAHQGPTVAQQPEQRLSVRRRAQQPVSRVGQHLAVRARLRFRDLDMAEAGRGGLGFVVRSSACRRPPHPLPHAQHRPLPLPLPHGDPQRRVGAPPLRGPRGHRPHAAQRGERAGSAAGARKGGRRRAGRRWAGRPGGRSTARGPSAGWWDGGGVAQLPPRGGVAGALSSQPARPGRTLTGS